jgi:hypothetical protein
MRPSPTPETHKRERCSVGPEDASWPVHSTGRGNTAMKGCSWPNFWANLVCFLLQRRDLCALVLGSRSHLTGIFYSTILNVRSYFKRGLGEKPGAPPCSTWPSPSTMYQNSSLETCEWSAARHPTGAGAQNLLGWPPKDASWPVHSCEDTAIKG